MSKQSDLPESEIWRITGRFKASQTKVVVVEAMVSSYNFNLEHFFFFFETENGYRSSGQCRRRATTPNDDQYLRLGAMRNQNMNATSSNKIVTRLLHHTLNSNCPVDLYRSLRKIQSAILHSSCLSRDLDKLASINCRTATWFS